VIAPVVGASLADRLADEIGAGRVVAALFSTFTFRREFFERLPLPLVTAEGRRRGLLPITVAVDRTQFEGSGWGYEVVRAPGGRRWHAKLIALMVEEAGNSRTVLAIGKTSRGAATGGFLRQPSRGFVPRGYAPVRSPSGRGTFASV
jgi:hypothetical protein